MAHVHNELPIPDIGLDEWLFNYFVWDNGDPRVGYITWRQTVEGNDARLKFEQKFMTDDQDAEAGTEAGYILTWDAVNDLLREGGPHVRRTPRC